MQCLFFDGKYVVAHFGTLNTVFSRIPFIFDTLTGIYICFCLMFSNISVTLENGSPTAVSADAKQLNLPTLFKHKDVI